MIQVSGHKVLSLFLAGCLYIHLISAFLEEKKNTETFPESLWLLPPLPVLRLTLWYPTYIRKQLIRRGERGRGERKKMGRGGNAAPYMAAPSTGQGKA